MQFFSVKSSMRGWLAVIALLLLASCGRSDSNTPNVSPAATLVGSSQELVNTFAARLTGAEETPPTQSNALGSGTVVANSDGRTAIVTLTTTGIAGTAAHIHEGAPGVAGPVIFPLNETSPGSGIWTSKITLTEAQFNSLQAGRFYFNVHSAAFPNGEIRGQILSQQTSVSNDTAQSQQMVVMNNTATNTAASKGTAAGTGNTSMDPATARTVSSIVRNAITSDAFVATLRGTQETPPNSSNALGAGAAVVDTATRSLVVAVTTTGITATEAHVHIAPPGSAGPVIVPLVETSPGSGIWTAKATLTEEQYNALVAGNLYLNVHSEAFPAGEIRGQLLPVLQSIAGALNAAGIGTTTVGTGTIGIDGSIGTIGTGAGTGTTGAGMTVTGTTGTGTSM